MFESKNPPSAMGRSSVKVPFWRVLWLMLRPSAFTGYIDVEARHIFFYFFESRSDPDVDDVIFWTNGGPGGSSSFGLFLELGTLMHSVRFRAHSGAYQVHAE